MRNQQHHQVVHSKH